MVYSLLWVVQDVYHQPWVEISVEGFRGVRTLGLYRHYMRRFYSPEKAKGYQLCYQAFVLEPHFSSLPKELLQTLRRKKNTLSTEQTPKALNQHQHLKPYQQKQT